MKKYERLCFEYEIDMTAPGSGHSLLRMFFDNVWVTLWVVKREEKN